MTADVRAAAEAWVEAVNLAAQEHPGLRIPHRMLPEAKAFLSALDRLSATLAEKDERIADLGAWNAEIRVGVEHLKATIATQAAELGRMRDGIKAIRRATLEGRVCDDVAWFDTITTLHDYCCELLDSPAPATKEGEA